MVSYLAAVPGLGRYVQGAGDGVGGHDSYAEIVAVREGLVCRSTRLMPRSLPSITLEMRRARPRNTKDFARTGVVVIDPWTGAEFAASM